MNLKLILTIFISLLVFNIVTAATWVDDPGNCPTSFQSQNCLGGEKLCGYDSGIVYCYDMSSLSPTSNSSTVSSVDDGSFDGGYVLDCEDYDSSVPFCDNSGSFWCDTNSAHQTSPIYRQTLCLAGLFGSTAEGDCISGNYDCYGDTDCESTTSTDCSACGVSNCRNSYDTGTCSTDHSGGSGTCACDSNWFACDSDINDSDGCEINTGSSCGSNTGYVVSDQCYSVSAGNCTANGARVNNRDCDDSDSDGDEITCNSGNGCEITLFSSTNNSFSVYQTCTTFACQSGYLDCSGSGDGTDSNGCEINAGTSCGNSTGTYAADQCQNNTGNCTSAGTQLDCNSDDGDGDELTCNGGVDGCEITDGGACSVGVLLGNYSGCSGSAGNCVVTKSYFETGTETSYSTADALLWGTQYGGGALLNFTNANTDETFLINGSGCIIFPDNTTQCSGTLSTDFTGVAFTNQTNNFTANQTFSENITVVNTGFFGWLGSIVNFITRLFVQDINLNGTLSGNGSINISGNVTADYFFGNGSQLVGITGSQVSDDGTFLLATGDTATGNYTFDLGTLFVDSSNNRVGIGTITPSSKFTIANDPYSISTATFVDSFSVSAQDQAPTGMAFNNNGTKLYVVGATARAIYEYNLSIAFDVSTGALVNNLSVSAQEGTPHGMVFNNDGTKVYVVGSNGDAVYEYNLSIAFNISTGVFNHNFSILEQDTDPRDLAFNNDGTKLYVIGTTGDAIYEYNLSTAFDVSTGEFNDNFSISAQDNKPTGMAFNNDGTKLYVIGDASKPIHEYNLSTAFDVSTGVNVSTLSVSAQDTVPQGMAFNNDGTKLYVVGFNGEAIYEYDVGGDLLTLDTDGNLIVDTDTLFVDSDSDRVGIGTKSPTQALDVSGSVNVSGVYYGDGSGLTDIGADSLSPDSVNTTHILDDTIVDADISDTTNLTLGQRLIFALGGFIQNIISGQIDVRGTLNVTDNLIVDKNLTVDTDTLFVDSDNDKVGIGTTSPSQKLDVNGSVNVEGNLTLGQKIVFALGGFIQNIVSGRVDINGTLNVTGNIEMSGSIKASDSYLFSDGSTQTVASTPNGFGWHVITASFNQAINVTTDETSPSGLFFKPDGTKMYIVGKDGDEVNEYNLSTPWDVSTFLNNQVLNVSLEELDSSGIFFKPDGTKMYIVGNNDDDITEYSLSTAWDINTSSFTQNFSVSIEDTTPTDVFFKPDGSVMYVLGNANDTLFGYDLTTPWDISTAVLSQSFYVGSQSAAPHGVSFKPDGTIMYVVDRNSEIIYEYNLYIPWNVSIAILENQINPPSGSGDSTDIFLKPDGSKLYVLKNAGDLINEYDLGLVIGGSVNINGSVGIGTTSPNDKLEVYGDLRINTAAAADNEIYFTDNGQIRSLDDNHRILFRRNEDLFEIREYGSIIFSSGATSGNETATMYLNSGGNVGIGTTSPSTTLEVNGTTTITGDLNVTGTSYLGDITIDADNITVNNIIPKDNGVVNVNGNLTLGQKIVFALGGFIQNIVSGRVDVNGTLNVTESTNIEGNLTVDNNTLFVDSDNNRVGIGTTTPTGKFTVGRGGDGYDISEAVFTTSFNLSGQATTGFGGLTFNNDGTKMYTITNQDDAVYEYNLSTAFDVSTAVYDSNFSVFDEDDNPRGLEFNNDGTKLYMVGNRQDSIFEYNLSTAFDVSTAVFNDNLSVLTYEGAPLGMGFNNDGTKLYIAGNDGNSIDEWDLSPGYDISTGSFNDTFVVSDQDFTPTGLAFNSDGTKLYVIGGDNDAISEYDLSPAFDVSTGVFVDNFNVSAQDTNARDVAFNSDGTKVYIIGIVGTSVYEYSLLSDLLVLDDDGNLSVDYNTLFVDAANDKVGIGTITPTTKLDVGGSVNISGVYYGNGSGLTGIGASSLSAGSINTTHILDETITDADINDSTNLTLGQKIVFALGGFIQNIISGRVDVNGTLNVTGGLNVDSGTLFVNGTNDRVGIGTTSPTHKLDVNGSIKSTETYVFYDGSTQSVASTPDGFGWHVITASFKQNFSVVGEETDSQDVFFKPDGTKMYMIGLQGDDVNEYNLTISWDVSTASFVQNFSVPENSAPRGLFFKPDGTKMYIAGSSGSEINEYDLSSPWNVSSISFNQVLLVSAQGAGLQDIFFKPDGTRMYIVGGTTDNVTEYDLSTAWDVFTADFIQSFDVNSEETFATGLFFKPGGTKMYVIGSSNEVNEYNLFTPWNISSASFNQLISVSAQGGGSTGLFFKPDGAKMYAIGTGGDSVDEYGLGLIIGGKVGIGISSPTQKLDVNGSVNVSGNMDIGGNTNIGGNLTVSNNIHITNGSLFQLVYGNDDGLILYLPFSEDSGDTSTAFDRSPYGNDGTLNGATCNVSIGKYGSGCSFDGITDSISIASVTNELSGEKGTITMWATFETFDNMDSPSLFGMRNGGDNFEAFENAGTLSFRYGDVTNEISYTVDFGANESHNFVFTWDNSSGAKIYVNGVEKASVSTTWTAMTPGGDMLLGKIDGSANTNLQGSIDEVFIYNRVLSLDEIRTQYLRGFGFGASGAIIADKFRIVNTSGANVFEVNSSGVALNGNLTLGQKIVFALEGFIQNIVSGRVDINGTLNVTDNLIVGGDLNVSGNTNIEGNLTVVNNIDITNGSLYQPVYGSDDGLVLYLPFSEPNGSTQYDRSPYGNDGTQVGATCNSTNGKYGSGCTFDGDDDYVDLGSFTNLDGATSLSVEFWIYKEEDGNFPSYDGVFARGTNSQRTPWVFGLSGTQILQAHIETTAGVADCNIFSNTITANAWTHIVLWWDGSTCKFYENGIATNSDTTTGSILANTDGNNYIGRINGFNNWNGSIDEVRVYTRALSEDEIRTQYLRGSGFGASGAIIADKFRIVNTSGTNVFEVNSSGVNLNGNLTLGQKIVFALGGFIQNIVSGRVDINGSLNVTGDLISSTIYDVSSQGLVLAMNFNNGSVTGSTVLDSSGNNNHGTNNGATYNATGGFDGLGSAAFEFDGVNDYIEISDDDSLDLTTEFTISAWIYRKSDSGGFERLIVKSDASDPGTADYSYFLQISPTDILQLGIVKADGTTTPYLDGVAAIPLNQWVYISTTKNSTDFVIYVNGAVDSTGVSSGTMGDAESSSFPLQIGRLGNEGSWSYGFNGTIDEVRVYERTLSSDEVKRLYLQRAEFHDSYVSQKDVYVDNGGKVGIGTTSPSAELEVVGDIVSRGTSWTSRTSAADVGWVGVAYGDGLFVVTGTTLSNTQRVMTSSDGVTWTNRTTPDVSNSWLSVVYGNGLFVAVANGGSSTLAMTSPDGINWTLRTTPTDLLWQSVTYGNGLFVAVASSGGVNRVMTSSDGITWTSRAAASNNDWFSVTYGDSLFVAVSRSSGTGNRVMTSSDGITWVNRTSAADNQWTDVTYGNGVFVAVSFDGSGDRVMTSSDGVTWISRLSASENNWYAVTYGDGLFVATSYDGSGNRVMTSSDGITWVNRTSAADNQWLNVGYGNGVFVAVSNSGTGNRVMTSGKSEKNVVPKNNIYQGGMSIFGNVGIGTASPTQALDVNGSVDVSENLEVLENASFVNGGFKLASFSGGYNSKGILDSFRMWPADDQTDYAEISISGGILDINMFDDVTDAITFSVVGSEKMRVVGSGNVGIGTTSPSSKLEVDGNVNLSDTLYVDNLGNVGIGNAVPDTLLTLGDGTNQDLLKFDTERGWKFTTNGSGFATTLDLQALVSGKSFRVVSLDGTEIPLQVFTTDTPADNAVYLVQTGGKVGIGTTSPGSLLEINGSSITTGTAFALSNLDALTSGVGLHISSSSSSLLDRELLKITNSNTLSSGTDLLYIENNGGGRAIHVDANSGSGNAIFLDSEATIGTGIFISVDALTTGYGMQIVSTSSSNSTNTLLTIINDNPLAIGNIALEIFQDASATGIALTHGGTGGTGILLDTTPMTTGTAISVSNLDALTTGRGLNINSNSASSDSRQLVRITNDNVAATNTIGLYIQQDSTAPAAVFFGNVGIGTTSPSTTLDVSGHILGTNIKNYYETRTMPTTVNDYVEIGYFALGASGFNLDISITVSDNNFSVAKRYVLPIQYAGSTTNVWYTALPISDTGVYVGNNFDLDVMWNTSNRAHLRIRRTLGGTSGTALIHIEQRGRSSTTFTNQSSTASTTAPSDYLETTVLTQVNGQVGIGTSNPSSKLEVDGNVSLNNALYVTELGDVGIGTTAPGIDLAGSTLDYGSGGTFLHTKSTTNYAIHTIEGQFGAFTDYIDLGGASNDKVFRLIVNGGIGEFQSLTDAFAVRADNILVMDMGTGNVGIGTASPLAPLHVNSTSNGTLLRLQDADGTCLHNPEAGSETVSCSSDERLKKNIRNAQSVLEEFKDIKIKDYVVKASGKETTGVIAQEINKTHPELVHEEGGELFVEQPNPWKLLKAIQELNEKLNNLVSGDYLVDSKPVFNEDSFGTAKVLANDTVIRVEFGEEYATVPIVVVTPLEFIDGAYKVLNNVTGGFSIVLQKAQDIDVGFNWYSFAQKVNEVKIVDVNGVVEMNIVNTTWFNETQDVEVNETIIEENETVVEVNSTINETVTENFNETSNVSLPVNGTDLVNNIIVSINETIPENRSTNYSGDVQGNGNIKNDNLSQDNITYPVVVMNLSLESSEMTFIEVINDLIAGDSSEVDQEVGVFTNLLRKILDLIGRWG